MENTPNKQSVGPAPWHGGGRAAAEIRLSTAHFLPPPSPDIPKWGHRHTWISPPSLSIVDLPTPPPFLSIVSEPSFLAPELLFTDFIPVPSTLSTIGSFRRVGKQNPNKPQGVCSRRGLSSFPGQTGTPGEVTWPLPCLSATSHILALCSWED